MTAISAHSSSSSAASGTYIAPKSTFGKRFAKLLFESNMPFVTSSLAGLSRGILGIVKPHLEVHRGLKLSIEGTQLLALWTIPIDLIGLVNGLSRTVFADSKEVQLDSGLDLAGRVVHICDGIANIGAGLVDIGAVASHVMTWAAPLTLACSLAGVVFYVIHGKAIHNNRKFLKRFKVCKTPSEAIKLVKNKKHTYRLEKHGGVTVSKFTKKIKAIQKKEAPDQDQKMVKAYEALKKRINWKQFSHALGVLVTTIGIIASILFFVSNAYAFVIAGSTLLVGLYVILMFRMGMELWANRQFNRAMRLT